MKVLAQFESKGNVELLSQKTLAIFSSKNTPQEIFNSAKKLFVSLCKMPLSLASGWQAPLEKHLLGLTSPVMAANIIYYSAKDINELNFIKLHELEQENKILYISAQSRKNRVSKEDIDKRDELMLSKVDAILFLYIEPKGRLEKYFDFLCLEDFSIFVLDHELNKAFVNAGAPSLNHENYKEMLPS